MPRERTNLQLDAANHMEVPGQRRPDHADQAWREPALWGEHQTAALVGELLTRLVVDTSSVRSK